MVARRFRRRTCLARRVNHNPREHSINHKSGNLRNLWFVAQSAPRRRVHRRAVRVVEVAKLRVVASEREPLPVLRSKPYPPLPDRDDIGGVAIDETGRAASSEPRSRGLAVPRPPGPVARADLDVRGVEDAEVARGVSLGPEPPGDADGVRAVNPSRVDARHLADIVGPAPVRVAVKHHGIARRRVPEARPARASPARRQPLPGRTPVQTVVKRVGRRWLATVCYEVEAVKRPDDGRVFSVDRNAGQVAVADANTARLVRGPSQDRLEAWRRRYQRRMAR